MDSLLTFAMEHTLFLALLIGWGLDLLLGDPAFLPHPVVYFGKWIAFFERRWNNGENRKVKGGVLAVMSILLVYVLTCAILELLGCLPVALAMLLRLGLSSILVFYCLAGRTLRQEVRMVFEAVDRSLEEGRTQVARIVGRDTACLSAQEVRTAALETQAENLSDGVIAPLFWLLLLGVPGMMTYKMVNTLDSMIGYQNERYKDFGCWAAHIDDIANYLPARLTAFLMILVGYVGRTFRPFIPQIRRSLRELAAFVLRYGPKHASPNSGWPEAALAGILDCRFGGSHSYFGSEFYKPHIGENARELVTQDMRLTLHIALGAEVLFVMLLLAAFAVF